MLRQVLKISLSLPLLVLAFTAPAHTSLEELSGQLTLKNPQVYTQRYITGGQPSKNDLKTLADGNVKLVLNLRGKGEFSSFDEQALVESLGMKYVSLPISGAKDINTENVRKFHDILGKHKQLTFVHCASGNRVGALFALEAFHFNNKTAEQALALGRQAGLTRLENQVRTMMAREK